MKITIIAVGKIKERFYREAVGEYEKRLSRYCKMDIIEVADEKTPDKCSEAEEEVILKREGERILRHIKSDMLVYALAIKGKKLDSLSFAGQLQQEMVASNSSLAFVIGGSLGLHREVLKRSNHAISFSDMTFPHPLMRVILTEQLYRCFRIIHKEPYHK